MIAGQRPVILFDPIGDSVQTALAARYDLFVVVHFQSDLMQGRRILPGQALDNLLGYMELERSRAFPLKPCVSSDRSQPPHEPLDDWLFPVGTPE